MKCKVARELLSPYLDGMLDSSQADALKCHLKGCLDCRREMEGLKELVSMLSGIQEECLPQGYHARLQGRLEEGRGKVHQAKGEQRNRLLPWMKYAGMIAAAVALLFSVRLLYRTGVENFVLFGYPGGDGVAETMDSSAPMEAAANGVTAESEPQYWEEGRDDVLRIDDEVENDEFTAIEEETPARQNKNHANGLKAVEPGFIQTDSVSLSVPDAHITIKSIMDIAAENEIKWQETGDDWIVLQIDNIEQRRILFEELSRLGTIVETGGEGGQGRLTVTIVRDE